MSDSSSVRFVITPGGHLSGRIRVPGDKSISHRAVMLGALAEGDTKIRGFLEGEDTLATLAAFRAMGVRAEGPDGGDLLIHGMGRQGLRCPEEPLYLGNSGTSMRLLAGLLAGQAFDVVLTGDASLSARPMRRVTEPLAAMGADIKASENGTPPLRIRGGACLRGIEYRMPVASAQVKSCLLLAGLYAQGRTCVSEPAPTRDHTERMLRGFGYPVVVEGNRVCVDGSGGLTGRVLEVPADISSATFFMVGAAIASGSELLLEHVGVNPTRTGVIEILRLMGADLTLAKERQVGGEPVADIRVRSSRLKGVRIPERLVPLAIDEFPAVFVAAACAEGETVLTGAQELRVKESDRIEVMANGLSTLGIDARPTGDGMIIRGGVMGGGELDSYGDHRVAMAFSMAGLRARDTVVIEDCANVNTSFPGFASLVHQAGLNMLVEPSPS